MATDADSAGNSGDLASAPMNAEDYPETAAGTTHGAGDAETQFVPPPTEAAPTNAWSNEDPVTEVLPRPWRSAWAVAGIGLLCAIIFALAIFGVVALVRDGHGGKQEANTTTPALPPALPTSSSPGPAATPPPATVTVMPPVAVTPPPTTVTAQAALPPASDHTDVFTICPDGHEGVVGGHTTCAFAANVRRIFYATGMSNSFTAFSPVTGDGYQMTCVGRYPAYFSDGSTMISTRCYGGDNAEVVIW
ncbi:MAG: hypothetical protein WCB92_31825 [Mycobacterium sp.]